MRTLPGQGFDSESPHLRVHRREVRDAVVVGVVGDVDRNTVEELEARLVDAARADVPLVADLTGVTFLDSSGLSVLVRCHERGVRDGGPFRVVVASRVVARPLALTSLDGLLEIHPTVEAALAA